MTEIKTKTCTTCGIEKEATREHFHYMKKGLYGLRSRCIPCSREYSISRYVYVVKPTHKPCSHCKKVLEINEDNFYKKITKAGTLIRGVPLQKDSHSFRHICKPCHKKVGEKRRRAKLMIKYNVTTDEELDIAIHNQKMKNIKRPDGCSKGSKAAKELGKKIWKYDYPEGLSKNERERYRKIMDKGFDPETYDEDWKAQWLESMKKQRVIPYPEGLTPEEEEEFKKWYQYENPTDGIIANKLGFKLEDVPKDVIELKRKQLFLYREVQKDKQLLQQKGMKVCPACSETLPHTLEYFHRYQGGLHHTCKQCINAYQRKYQEKSNQ